MAENEAIVIGLCGGIGSGKSTVAKLLAESGAAMIDADSIAHEVLKAEDVKRAIGERWGMEVIGPDGEVDRAALGRRIFCENAGNAEGSDARELEELVHPRIRARMDCELATAREGGGVIVIDAPLLFEAGLDELCDALVFVAAAEDVREERVGRRHGWTPTELARRQARQMTLEAKRAKCGFSIDNSGALTRTAAMVGELYDRLTSGDLGNRSRTPR